MLTIAQVAERLQVSRQLVYALVEAGELPAHRFGLGRGTVRVSEDDLQTYIGHCRTGGRPEQRPQTHPVRSRHFG